MKRSHESKHTGSLEGLGLFVSQSHLASLTFVVAALEIR